MALSGVRSSWLILEKNSERLRFSLLGDGAGLLELSGGDAVALGLQLELGAAGDDAGIVERHIGHVGHGDGDRDPAQHREIASAGDSLGCARRRGCAKNTRNVGDEQADDQAGAARLVEQARSSG